MSRQREIVSEAIALLAYLEKINKEVVKAGGSPFTVEFLSKLTAMEFLATIAPNGLVIKREDV